MIQIIKPGARAGYIEAPSSKSMAHRFLICAALGEKDLVLHCPGMSKDIEATIACLNRLGADIRCQNGEVLVHPVCRNKAPQKDVIELPCAESGSTLRFLLPLAGALGQNAVFRMEGRLPERPMEEFQAELMRHGMQFRKEGNCLYCSGQLKPGTYLLPGNISSQYFSGLLFAAPLMPGDSRIQVEGKLESQDYLRMTEIVLKQAGIHMEKDAGGYCMQGRQVFDLPGAVRIEGDYSGAAFFLCAGAISETKDFSSGQGITVGNLSENSAQGDRRVTEVLARFGARTVQTPQAITVQKGKLKGIVIDASMIPDLIPALSVVAAVSEGTTSICHAERLRMKESDRIKSTIAMLTALGADAEETEDGMRIYGKPKLRGGCVDPSRDHRIAMAAAIAACVCEQDVIVKDAECVQKSYPDFWRDLAQLTS